MHLLRNPRYYPLLRALINNEVSRLDFKGALDYFTYACEGDEVLATDEDQRIVLGVIGKAIGRKVRAMPKRLKGHAGCTTLTLSQDTVVALLLEMLALGANLSPHDLETMPKSLDIQLREATR